MRWSLLFVSALALGCSQPKTNDVQPQAQDAQAQGAQVQEIASDAAAAIDAAIDAPADAAVDATSDGSIEDSRKGTLVVHIGDSFTEAWFEQNLRARFSAVGARYWVQAENSSYTVTWAYGDKLDSMLWSKPQLVLINLGANEVDILEPEKRAPAVRAVVKKASKWGSCVWILPPQWKKDSGFMQVIRDNVAPCVLFDSDEHVSNVERRNDKIHPNEVGGAKWAAAFWDWLEAQRDPSRGPWALKP